MATSGLYGSSPSGATVAAPGSESAGLYGNTTTFGGTYFEWFIFIQSETQPATPTGGSWSFTTNSGTPPTGWSVVPPSAPTLPIWVSIALVNSRNTGTLTWSAPGLFAYASGLPILSGSGEPNPGDGLTNQLYIQTGTTPETIWFKQAGTWTRLTGSTLYADLTSNQTIAGTKTFSNQIQGSVSGTSSNVTGIVGITNGGTGSTTAAGARTALGVTATGQDTTYAYRANNLSDLASASSARTNLGLGTSAVLDAGVANGVATLDSGGTVPLSQIPASIQGGVSYQGTWNASTNTPTLTSSVGTKGYYYVVSVAGSTNLNGITDWQIGDWAIYSGTAWQKIDNTDAVTSVNGYTGTVVLNAADVGALSNVTSTDGSVTITSPTSTTRDLSVATAASTTNVLCQVRNATGATLTKGTVVYISGATGQLPTVSKAIATGDSTSAQTLGMMTADLANNSNGYVTVIGLITNIDTSAYTDGAQLYLSGTTAGAVTATKPSAPIHLVYIAVVEYAHPTQGKLFVKVQNGYELDEIHDVSIVSPVTGQTLVYNATTDLWENNTVSLTAGVNGTLPIANGGTGQTTANAAFNALAPSQTGNSGKYLTTDGTNTSWAVNAGGDVVGPASSTNNGIALFDGTTGKLLKDSASTDGLIYGITVGRGLGAVATNTAVGALTIGISSGGVSGTNNTAFGYATLSSLTSGTNNTGSGWAALNAITSGSSNTASGSGALQNNTTASNNTAIGYQAAYSNTTGTQNVALGAQSLRSVTTGGSNTAIGYASQYGTTTAFNNVSIGDGSMYANTTGANNIGIGIEALRFNTTASNNTAVGYQAGYTNTTGTRLTAIGLQAALGGTGSAPSYSVAVGSYALRNITTGIANTAVGDNSMGLTTTGQSNVAIGQAAFYSNITGSNNVAIGLSALQANTTGYNSTAVGYQASYSNTTGATSTAIGYQTLFSNATANYNTALGYQAGYANTAQGVTFVGHLVGRNSTTGIGNVAVGGGDSSSIVPTFYTNTTGAYNTVVGAGALAQNTTANNNTAVGFQAGYANTTGYGNAFVGTAAGTANTTGAANAAFGGNAPTLSNAALQSNTTGSQNSAFGVGALGLNTTGSSGTAVGYQALYSSTGNNNTAVGQQAAKATTSGEVTAVGALALTANTTGTLNTAVGAVSLYSNTTGSNNVAVGRDALRFNTTADNNTAVGYQAGYSNTTGTSLAFVGFQAGYTNSTGNDNSAFGMYALVSNSTGGQNTAIGKQALAFSTTASNNTVVGYQAGYNNTTGTQNVRLGGQAGYTNSTGNYSTYLGYASGYLATGNLNTFVGTGSGYNVTTGAQNTFVGTSTVGAGYYMTTGSKNTILGGFSGNQGGLDIRTASNYIVLSDGDGNPRQFYGGTVMYRQVTGNDVRQGEATINWANASSASQNMESLFPALPGGVNSNFLIQIVTGSAGTNGSSAFIVANKTATNSWSFNTTNVGAITTTPSGSGATLTLTFSSGAQYGYALIRALVVT